jgi:tyrosyl-tRNA synthetase
VGVTEPPEEIFGKVMSIPDEVMPVWYELLVDEPFDPAEPPNEAKRRLARLLVDRFHGEGTGERAEAHFDRLFREHQAPEEMPEIALPDGDTVHVPALLRDAFGISASEARRLLAQGGVRLNGEVLSPEDLDVPLERLDSAIVQVGKRRFARFHREG